MTFMSKINIYFPNYILASRSYMRLRYCADWWTSPHSLELEYVPALRCYQLHYSARPHHLLNFDHWPRAKINLASQHCWIRQNNSSSRKSFTLYPFWFRLTPYDVKILCHATAASNYVFRFAEITSATSYDGVGYRPHTDNVKWALLRAFGNKCARWVAFYLSWWRPSPMTYN